MRQLACLLLHFKKTTETTVRHSTALAHYFLHRFVFFNAKIYHNTAAYDNFAQENVAWQYVRSMCSKFNGRVNYEHGTAQTGHSLSTESQATLHWADTPQSPEEQKSSRIKNVFDTMQVSRKTKTCWSEHNFKKYYFVFIEYPLECCWLQHSRAYGSWDQGTRVPYRGQKQFAESQGTVLPVHGREAHLALSPRQPLKIQGQRS